MTENEVVKCPRCGKTVLDREANYCPYCAEPLGKLGHKSNRVIFWLGVVFTLVGIVPVVFVDPRTDHSRIISEAALELWLAGVFCLLGGLILIVYSYYLIRQEAKGEESLTP